MIQTPQEYASAKALVQQMLRTTEENIKRYSTESFTSEQVTTLVEPEIAWRMGIEDEIKVYEDAKNGILGSLENLEFLGRYLINLRISKGMSQAQLAEKLNSTEQVVSKNERNEYHGSTIQYANQVLVALGANLNSFAC